MEEAVAWCKENGCRGQAALSSGLFPTIGCPKTINRRLDGEVMTGQEKQYCSFMKHIRDRNYKDDRQDYMQK